MYPQAYIDAVTVTLGIEQGKSNNPKDTGGLTYCGITAATSAKFGYPDPTKLTQDQILDIYYRGYWSPLKLDQVAALSAKVAAKLFDINVNCRFGTAGRFLQRALNNFNKEARLYSDITIDGGIGSATLTVLQSYFKTHDSQAEHILLEALNTQLGVYYFECCESNENNEEFVYGWYAKRIQC